MFSTLAVMLILCGFSSINSAQINEECNGYANTITVNETHAASRCDKNGDDHVTCNSLDKALNQTLNDTCIVLLSNAEMNEFKSLSYIQHLKIVSNKHTIIACNQADQDSSDGVKQIGIQFHRCSDVKLSKLIVQKCGSPLYLHGESGSQERISSAVAFVQCANVTVQDTTIRYNYGYGLSFLDTGGAVKTTDVYGNLPVTSSSDGGCYSGGGVFIQYSENAENLNLSVTTTRISMTKYDGIKPRGSTFTLASTGTCNKGSGMAIYFLNGAVRNQVNVGQDSYIGSNAAKHGAGVYVSFEETAKNNKLYFSNGVYFSSNIASDFGGAIHINDASATVNEVCIKSCQFVRNIANAGAGVFITHLDRFSLYDNTDEYKNLKIQIISSTFDENRAFVGVAIFVQNENITIKSIIVKKSNTPEHRNGTGQGALYALGSSLHLNGENKFSRNNNSAIVLDSSQVTLHRQGTIYLTNNLGYNGGGICFYEHSQLQLSNSAKMFFQNNHATNKGGAIYVVTPGPLVMPLGSTELSFYKCFITFENDLSFKDFQGNITFVDNLSGDHGSNDIFTSSLQSCRHPSEDSSDIFTKWPSFRFVSNNSISTHATSMFTDKTEWTPYPGEIFNATVKLYDERQNNVSESINVKLGNSDVSVKGDSAFFVQRNQPIRLSLKGLSNATFAVTVTTTSGIPLQKKLLNRRFKQCPFGFKLKGRECQCDVLNNLKKGIVECSTRHVFLFPNRWVDKLERGTIVCPAGYCRSKTDDCKPYCVYQKSEQCRIDRDQSSRLCGKCLQGRSSVIGSSECRLCQGSHTYITVTIITFVGLGVFIGVVMLLNVDIMSYNINICLFAYQIIDILYALDQPTDRFLDFVVSIFQFTDRNTAYPAYCLWDGLNAMQKCAYDYVVPASMMIIMFVLYHCHFKWPHRVSLVRWYKTLSIVSIMCFADLLRVSFQLLAPVHIDGNVYLYIYAEAPFFGKEHLPYGVVAVLVVIMVLTSLIISVVVVFKENSSLGRPLNWISRLEAKLCVYLHEDVHWFWVFYIVCRILIYAIGIFSRKNQMQNSMLATLCFFMTLGLTTLQPYNDEERNVIESLVLVTLTFISVFTLGMDLVYFPEIREAYSVIIHILSYAPVLALVYTIPAPLYRKCCNERKQYRRTTSAGPMRVFENDNFRSGYVPYREVPQGEE